MPKAAKIEWYARGGGIARVGPFKTQAKASKYLIGTDGFPVKDAFVWPVEVKVRTPRKTKVMV